MTPEPDDQKKYRNRRGRGGRPTGIDAADYRHRNVEIVLRSLKREATAVCVGVPKQPHTLDITHYLIKHGLTLKGTFGRSLWQTWDVLAALVSRGRLDLDSLVTHRVGFPGFQGALDLQTGGAGKVILIPSMSYQLDTLVRRPLNAKSA